MAWWVWVLVGWTLIASVAALLTGAVVSHAARRERASRHYASVMGPADHALLQDSPSAPRRPFRTPAAGGRSSLPAGPTVTSRWSPRHTVSRPLPPGPAVSGRRVRSRAGWDAAPAGGRGPSRRPGGSPTALGPMPGRSPGRSVSVSTVSATHGRAVRLVRRDHTSSSGTGPGLARSRDNRPRRSSSPSTPVRRRTGLRWLQRAVAVTALLVVGTAPVLARTAGGLSMGRALAAELAGNSQVTTQVLAAIDRGFVRLDDPADVPEPAPSTAEPTTAPVSTPHDPAGRTPPAGPGTVPGQPQPTGDAAPPTAGDPVGTTAPGRDGTEDEPKAPATGDPGSTDTGHEAAPTPALPSQDADPTAPLPSGPPVTEAPAEPTPGPTPEPTPTPTPTPEPAPDTTPVPDPTETPVPEPAEPTPTDVPLPTVGPPPPEGDAAP